MRNKPFKSYVLDRPDLVLLMTVNPGFGGQAFIPTMADKVARVKRMIGERQIHIEIDGGVTSETASLIKRAGADVLVAGSAVSKDGPQAYAGNIAAIRAAEWPISARPDERASRRARSAKRRGRSRRHKNLIDRRAERGGAGVEGDEEVMRRKAASS
jgi:hypothetical protein